MMRRLLRRLLLPRVLRPDELRMLVLLNTADRWRYEAPLTAEEAQRWGAVMDSALGAKINTAMQCAIVQEAQRAVLQKPEFLPYAAGYAAGVRAGWGIVQAISTAVADSTEPESRLPESAGLDHLTP